jgi:hypothetical protein
MPGQKAYHLTLSILEDWNVWSHISTPPVRLHEGHRNNLIFLRFYTVYQCYIYESKDWSVGTANSCIPIE